MKFNFDVNESTDLKQNCQLVDNVITPKILKADWWSNKLVTSAKSRFYCEKTEGYMVVDRDTVYYWEL